MDKLLKRECEALFPFGPDEGPVRQVLQKNLPILLRILLLRTTLISQDDREERQKERVGRRHGTAHFVGHALDLAEPRSFVPRPVPNVVEAQRDEGKRQ